MSYDYGKLKGRIVEIFGTQKKFAESIGFSERTLSLKLNNKVAWRQDEISKAQELLKIEDKEINDYFFNKKSSIYLNF